MRTAFLLLLLVNLVLFAWQQARVGPGESGREPQRLALQVAPEKLRVLAAGELLALQGPSGGAGGGKATPACLEFGDFDAAVLARIESRLAELVPADRLQARRADAPDGFVVYLPAAASRADAERVALDLRGRGVRDLIVMGPNTPTPNAILLGSFRDSELAERHQADLIRRGVKGVQVAESASNVEATRFRVGGVDAALARQLTELQKEFPQSRLTSCAN